MTMSTRQLIFTNMACKYLFFVCCQALELPAHAHAHAQAHTRRQSCLDCTASVLASVTLIEYCSFELCKVLHFVYLPSLPTLLS